MQAGMRGIVIYIKKIYSAAQIAQVQIRIVCILFIEYTCTHSHITHCVSKFTLYVFIYHHQNIGSCKISSSCPCGGVNRQPRGPVSIQAKLQVRDGHEE